ncbi:fumarylacetoacetate hydrolase family protein [Arenibaculum sp.]|jgi:fumarylacetoacetate (FAA) hydrolase|uniref:fumarylacetoacetate hydrolase family protein n=1 Tax=Arenibaculum sp. TaxID=2865862 RepID=UPI002E0E2687|nr:fumarylacetoacetate hydrolase family protein [Arenibaculum sp.]
MKLASLKEGGRDGTLVVVSWDLAKAVRVPSIAPTLQSALDRWSEVEVPLKDTFHKLDTGRLDDQAFPFDPAACAAPLPRAYQWADGSAYVNHVELVRKARGAEMPASFWTDPLMYQGGSDRFIGPRDPIELADESWGCDFESEVAVVTDDVPMGVTPDEAVRHIKLVMLVNDVSLRNLIPGELAKGFGFFQSKPASAFSPVAGNPDALGDVWDGRKVRMPLRNFVNGTLFGEPNAGVDMTFDFAQLIAHAARTRHLGAGTVIGSGTVSNRDRSTGSSCIAEQRMLETIDRGEPSTPFLRWGDRVRIEMLDDHGINLFGTIDQEVVRYSR